jgi:hypothetical protein
VQASRRLHVRVSQAGFGKIFEAMREWLDGNNCVLEHFGTEGGDGGDIIVKAQFAV